MTGLGYQNSIIEYLSHVTNESEQDKLNICAWVYSRISESGENASAVLKFFFENADNIESDDSWNAEIVFSESDAREYRKKYGALTDAIFEKLIAENLPEEQFYEKLWESINGLALFDTAKIKAFAIYYIWIDVRIPYYQLNEGMHMSNQRFAEITNGIRDDITKARFILRTNKFESRTKRASVLLELLDSHASFEERTVLMAHIISFLKPALNDSILRELLNASGLGQQDA